MLYQAPHEHGKRFLHLAIKLKPKFQIIVETQFISYASCKEYSSYLS